jgi:IS5 family transposase
VTADRQYGEAAVEAELAALGVERVAIPRKGQPGRARQATEHTRSFRRLVKWRTGAEGRISHLKHRYGWDRTLMDGIDGARIWCGQGPRPQPGQDQRPAGGQAATASVSPPTAQSPSASCRRPTQPRTASGPSHPTSQPSEFFRAK